MRGAYHISKSLGYLYYYTSLPLAFVVPDARAMNAMLGIFVGMYIGKNVAGVALMLAAKKKKDAEIGYSEEKKGLSRLFNKENGGSAIKYLLAGTAIATAAFIGTNTYKDVVDNNRAPLWALLGNTFDTAYRPVSWTFSKAADFGQVITHTLNPVPEEYKHAPLLQFYGRTVDGYAQCADRAIRNEDGFVGTCHNNVQRHVNPVFDRK